MIYYDSSALVKKYAEEAGSDAVLRLIAQGGPVITSKLAYPEIIAGLGRKRREKALSEKDYQAALEDFDADWREFLIVELQDELLPVMRQLSSRHALKGADLVHLGSAVWFGKAVREKMTFAAADVHLLKIARLERMATVDPGKE
jgi:hypothetical protein